MAAPRDPRSRYDTTLQMFVEDAPAPDMRRLRFLRWLAERGCLEHEVAGAPSGPLVAALESTIATPH